MLRVGARDVVQVGDEVVQDVDTLLDPDEGALEVALVDEGVRVALVAARVELAELVLVVAVGDAQVRGVLVREAVALRRVVLLADVDEAAQDGDCAAVVGVGALRQQILCRVETGRVVVVVVGRRRFGR